MAERTVGTYDFYFDMADKLEALGTEFSLVVKQGDGCIVLSNVQSSDVARNMLRAQDNMYRDRFNPNPDAEYEDQDGEDDEDDPSTE
jgi:hypothetical protein